MTIRHLKIFATVCEEGGITKAGQRLFMSQPTVSYAITELEKYYGTKLFDRISNRLHLTDAGRKLLPYAQHIVSMLDEMETEIRDCDSGTIRVGASITIGNCMLPGLLKSFEKRRHGIDVKVMIDNSKRIEQSVLDNSIDLGMIEGVSHGPNLISESFMDDELVLLFAPGHRWEAQSVVKPKELENEPFLFREHGSGVREILESALLLHDIEIKPAWESISTQAIVQAMTHGLGVAVLPLMLVEDHLANGTLLTRPIDGISLNRKFVIIHHKSKYITSAMQEFINLCSDVEN